MDRFGLRDFIKLRWLAFIRRPLRASTLILRILKYIFLALMFLEVVFFGFLPLLIFKQENIPVSRYLTETNKYIFIFIGFAFFFNMMINNYSSLKIKPFLLLPIHKKRIVRYYLATGWINITQFTLITWVVIVSATFLYAGVPPGRVIPWALALVLTTIWFNMLAWTTEKSPLLYVITTVVMFATIGSIKKHPEWLEPAGKIFQSVADGNLLSLSGFVILVALTYIFIEKYLLRSMYLDTRRKKQEKIYASELKWTDYFGKTGAYIQNDIRLILRNKRTRMLLMQMLVTIFYGVFIFASGLYDKNGQDFWKVFAVILLSGTFMINFGGFTPSWDSEYFKLLVSQSVNFRLYLEAKWRLMVFSVLVMTILSLPFAYFGKDVLMLLIAFAFFNAGINSFFVLWTGIFNKTPVKLNSTQQAFQKTQSGNFKVVFIIFLRILIPILLYFPLKKFLGFNTAVLIISLLGIAGMLLKNPVLNYLARLYNRHKYDFVESYSKLEEL